jgi:predicted nucleotidyltransferase
MMESSSAVTNRVIDTVEATDEVPAGTKLYLFGSCLSDSGTPHDLDVLLVYRDGELGSAHLLAESIREILEHGVHLLVLSDTEERELAFIASEEAHLIWPEAS